MAFTLTTSASTGGTVLPVTGSYEAAEVVAVTATPASGYRFSAWTGTAVVAGKVADPLDPTSTVTMTASYSLVANFEPVPADASINIEEALYTILTSDATVAASVSTRVFMGFLPQGKDLPAITWTMISDIPAYHSMGMCGLSQASFQIDCWALTFGAVRTLQKAVINALSGYHATVDGLVVQSILITDIADASTYPAEMEVRKTYGKRIDIEVFYENNLGV